MKRFIGEPILPEFNGQPRLSKKTGCPVRFRWRDEAFSVAEMLSEWHSYGRRGRAAINMTPAHAQAALERGSRGVGRDYFKVRTSGGRVFTIYYDRAPKSVEDSLGEWILLEEELAPQDDSSRKNETPAPRGG
jgi:hypothetical protein